MTNSVLAQLTTLPEKTTPELKQLWRDFYDREPPPYGFRPKKACRDALEHIRNAIRPTGTKTETDWPRPPYQWVIEGDIQGCLDAASDCPLAHEACRKRSG
jgi:hypothetical protein